MNFGSNGGSNKPTNGGAVRPALPPELLSAEQAAKFLGLESVGALYHMKHRKQFHGYGVVVQLGRRTMYSRTGLLRFIEAHRV